MEYKIFKPGDWITDENLIMFQINDVKMVNDKLVYTNDDGDIMGTAAEYRFHRIATKAEIQENQRYIDSLTKNHKVSK